MNNRQREDLDRHITGRWGEDSVGDEPRDKATCSVCGKEVDTFESRNGKIMTVGHKDQYGRFCSGGVTLVMETQ